MLVGATVVCGGATRLLIPFLQRRNVLDRPNARSLHAVPTPRGGGIAVIATVLMAWLGIFELGRVGVVIVPVCLAAGLLAAICWIDDLHDLSPVLRLVAQAAAVAIGLAALPENRALAQQWLGALGYEFAAGFVWLWWINAYNFMDGIDGIAGSEAAAIAGGLLLAGSLGKAVDATLVLLPAPVFGAALGFLRWNWSPARIFLGDVGSVPLGYLTGFLLLGAAAAGRWELALILPLYFLADATVTLGRRLCNREKVWEAHRGHFYQRAVGRGLSHAAVVERIIIADLALIACAWAAENIAGAPAVAAAIVVVTVLLAVLSNGR